MAKSKKKPSSHKSAASKSGPKTVLKKAGTFVKPSKAAKKLSKPSKPVVNKVSKPTVHPKVAASGGKPVKAKLGKMASPEKTSEKLEKAKKEDKLKKVKPEEKKLEKSASAKEAVKEIVKETVKETTAEPKISKEKTVAKVDKTKKGKEPEPVEEFDDIEEDVLTYGDAIRLTPQDLEDPEELVLTDAEGRRYCKVKDCDQLAVVEGHCRFHYLALWKKIQTRKKILTDGKLEKYIEELTSRYPDKYLEMIRRDLKTEKDFISAIQELEIDDSAEGEFEEDSSFIDEVRGIGAARGPRGTDETGGGSEDF